MHFFTVSPQIKLSSNALFAEEGQNVTIASTATGQPQPSITWSMAFGSLPKGRTEVLSGKLKIYNVTKKDGGTYICEVKNILRSATDSAQLDSFSSEVQSPPSSRDDSCDRLNSTSPVFA